MLFNRFRIVVVTIALSAIILTGVPVCAEANIHKVKLTNGIEERFPHINLVLNQLVRTMDTPSDWDATLWDSRVKGTGKVVNYKLKDIVASFRKYLTDGSLTLNYRPDPKAKELRAAGSTTKNKISLNSGAGSWQDGGKNYSDYQLAVTIFHELMHNWQQYNWYSTGEYIPLTWDKETVAYAIEKFLPKGPFDNTKHPDPGIGKPVPEDFNGPDALWRKAEGLWKSESGGTLQVYSTGTDQLSATMPELSPANANFEMHPGDFSFEDAYPISNDSLRTEHAHVYPEKGDKIEGGEYKKASGKITISSDGNTLTLTLNGIQYGRKSGETTYKWRPDKVVSVTTVFHRVVTGNG